ncbi:hypothetical protein [Fibrella arboris]|uniref:hypothetical protein n=1 Tax=Fibrella arboris TaxID=3242486 RepID=UPI0035226AFA
MEEDEFALEISVTLYGAEFSPRKLLSMSTLVFSYHHEKGDEFRRKTYVGIYGNGAARLTVSVKSLAERDSQFDRLLDMVVDNYQAIQASGATDIDILVAVFRSIQGNWAATAAHIQKIASVNGSLAVTYYRKD